MVEVGRPDSTDLSLHACTVAAAVVLRFSGRRRFPETTSIAAQVSRLLTASPVICEANQEAHRRVLHSIHFDSIFIAQTEYISQVSFCYKAQVPRLDLEEKLILFSYDDGRICFGAY